MEVEDDFPAEEEVVAPSTTPIPIDAAVVTFEQHKEEPVCGKPQASAVDVLTCTTPSNVPKEQEKNVGLPNSLAKDDLNSVDVWFSDKVVDVCIYSLIYEYRNTVSLKIATIPHKICRRSMQWFSIS